MIFVQIAVFEKISEKWGAIMSFFRIIIREVFFSKCFSLRCLT